MRYRIIYEDGFLCTKTILCDCDNYHEVDRMAKALGGKIISIELAEASQSTGKLSDEYQFCGSDDDYNGN